MTTQSKPPPKKFTEEELVEARKELADACVATDVASKKHDAAVEGLKKTISDPKFRAVRLPTPSEVELTPEKR